MLKSVTINVEGVTPRIDETRIRMAIPLARGLPLIIRSGDER